MSDVREPVLKLLLAFAAMIILAGTTPYSCLAQDDDFSPSALNQKFDWVITVDTEVLPQYLKYPSSGLNPLTKMVVTYRNTNRLGRPRPSDDILYEELWYHECKPIGCRRFNPLNIQSGEQGCIYFKQTKDIQNCSCSVANAIVRLLLDIGLQSAMLSAAIVPSGIFSQTVDNFGVFKFYPYNISPETGLAATMHVHLTAQPSGQDQSVYYFGN